MECPICESENITNVPEGLIYKCTCKECGYDWEG